MQGLYLSRYKITYDVSRIHNNSMGFFMTALVPSDRADLELVHDSLSLKEVVLTPYSPSLQPLHTLGPQNHAIGIFLPSRTPKSALRPLQGLRFSEKDAIRLRRLETSLCNAGYLSVTTPSKRTIIIVLRTIAAGAQVVGLTELSSMIGKEELTEATDFYAPLKPRRDGYQSTAGSSSGSAVAVAAYSWPDFAIGTDTTGSARCVLPTVCPFWTETYLSISPGMPQPCLLGM